MAQTVQTPSFAWVSETVIHELIRCSQALPEEDLRDPSNAQILIRWVPIKNPKRWIDWFAYVYDCICVYVHLLYMYTVWSIELIQIHASNIWSWCSRFQIIHPNIQLDLYSTYRFFVDLYVHMEDFYICIWDHVSH